MICYICLEPITNTPLLTCRHSLCSKCYCNLKSNKKNNCLLCDKKLVRGRGKANINNL